MPKPKISVITPSFNQGAYIKDTIESVLSQNYEPFEHIIVDGGSTDNTVEILKQYPHLVWTSEKDDGQSDALNKALAKSTGEIIAWINSDDWYEPDTFTAVAEALTDYPVVMGGCAIRNADGQVTLELPNAGRIWFDILKYWIGYSIPTQPAIFFRKDLLPPLERIPGQLFDVGLNYAMDYDLWLRMAIRAPFVKTIDRRLANYRMTENNKTSDKTDLSHAEPEMARVFKRAETVALSPTYTFSVLLPVTELTDSVRNTVETVLLQSSGDFELLLIARDTPNDAAKSAADFKALKQFVSAKNAEQNKAHRDSYCWTVKAEGSDVFQALNAGFQTCEGRYVAVLEEGVLLGTNFLADALTALHSNRIGMLLPWRQNFKVYDALSAEPGVQHGAADFPISKLFDVPALPLFFVARRTALLECGDVFRQEPRQKIIRELIATVLYKGWHVSAQRDLRATSPVPIESEVAFLDANRQRIAAEIVVTLDTRLNTELFARARAQHGTSMSFDAVTVANCRALIEKMKLLQ